MIYAILAMIGVIAGILSGMFGIGGGVLLVPVLMLIAKSDLESAKGTSLAVLLTPVRFPGVAIYYRKRLVDIRAAACIAVGILLTNGVTALLSVRLDEWLASWLVDNWQFDPDAASTMGKSLMRRLSGLFVLFVSFRFIQPIHRIRLLLGHREERAAIATPPDDEPIEHDRGTMIRCVIVGMVAGFAQGMFGVGGGVVIVPLLTWACHISPKRAVATSLAAILLPVALPAAMVYYQSGAINIAYAAVLAGGLLAGTAFGAKVTVKLRPETVKELFGFLTLAMALKYLISG